MSKYWVFQDESGEPGDDIFIVGILCMTSSVKRKLLDIVRSVRDKNKFYDEIHFQVFSNFRDRVYKEVLDEAFRCYFSFKSIVIRKEDVDLKYFGYKKHLAYNKFSELLIYHHIKKRVDDIHIRPDEKNRLKEDNFYSYLMRNLNEKAFLEGHNYSVKSCKSTASDKCDVVQICDLLTGVVKNKYSPAGARKNAFGEYIRNKYASRINIWEWKPKNKL